MEKYDIYIDFRDFCWIIRKNFTSFGFLFSFEIQIIVMLFKRICIYFLIRCSWRKYCMIAIFWVFALFLFCIWNEYFCAKICCICCWQFEKRHHAKRKLIMLDSSCQNLTVNNLTCYRKKSLWHHKNFRIFYQVCVSDS